MSERQVILTAEQMALCAHDLRGALTVISGYNSLLRRGELSDADRLRALDGIDAAIGRADALLSDTLSGRIARAIPREHADLGTLAEQAAADARAAFGREVSVLVEGPAEVPGNAVELARVLQNLLSNAAKYAPEGAIDVSIRRADGNVVLEVADRGPGIPASQREAVLRPFTRLPRDEATPGNGLGLALVSSVAERLRGRVEIADREGGGSIVRVTLPAGD